MRSGTWPYGTMVAGAIMPIPCSGGVIELADEEISNAGWEGLGGQRKKSFKPMSLQFRYSHQLVQKRLQVIFRETARWGHAGAM